MSLTYESRNERVTEVRKDGERVGVITEHNGQIGFRVFGAPVSGNVDSVEDAKKALEAHFN